MFKAIECFQKKVRSRRRYSIRNRKSIKKKKQSKPISARKRKFRDITMEIEAGSEEVGRKPILMKVKKN